MLILHGHYKFRKRKVSCRNDYCTICNRDEFTEGIRSFRVIHIFFIPLIPIGFATEWRCTSCGKDPFSRRPISRGLAITGFVLSLSLLAVSVAALWEERRNNPGGLCIVLVMLGGLAFVTANSLSGKRRSEYLARRKAVMPLRTDVCPYCATPTFQRSTIRCELCKITIK